MPRPCAGQQQPSSSDAIAQSPHGDQRLGQQEVGEVGDPTVAGRCWAPGLRGATVRPGTARSGPWRTPRRQGQQRPSIAAGAAPDYTSRQRLHQRAPQASAASGTASDWGWRSGSIGKRSMVRSRTAHRTRTAPAKLSTARVSTALRPVRNPSPAASATICRAGGAFRLVRPVSSSSLPYRDGFVLLDVHLLRAASHASRRSRPTAQPGLGAAPPWRPARSQGSAPSSHPGLRVKMATGNETAKAPQARRSPA